MIKKTKKRFILLSSILIILIFLIILSSVFVITEKNEDFEVDRAFNRLLINPPNSNFPTNSIIFPNSFKYVLNLESNKATINYDINSYLENDILSLINQISKENQTEGNISTISYKIIESEDFRIILGIDRSREREILNNNMLILLIVLLTSFVIIFLIILKFSEYVIRPLKISIQKQNEFISDASHDLKTPIAIISANAEVIKDELNDSKWVNNIVDQVEHMNFLINDLLSYASINETDVYQKETFNLSETLHREILSFEALIFEESKQLEVNITPNITLHSNQKMIKKLISIFMDNAIKYSEANGRIIVSLDNKQGVELKFYNTGSELKNEDLENIFDRFYKISDNNKSHGLGLSIAKSICEKLDLTINVNAQFKEYTEFNIKFK